MTTQDTTMHTIMCGQGGPHMRTCGPAHSESPAATSHSSGTPPGAQVMFHQSCFIFVNNLRKKSYLYFLLIFLSVLFLKLSISSNSLLVFSVNFLFYHLPVFYFTWLLSVIMMITHTHTHNFHVNIFLYGYDYAERPRLWKYSPIFFQSHYPCIFMFKPLIHLDMPFVYGMGLGITLHFSPSGCSANPVHILNNPPISQWLEMPHLSSMSSHRAPGLSSALRQALTESLVNRGPRAACYHHHGLTKCWYLEWPFCKPVFSQKFLGYSYTFTFLDDLQNPFIQFQEKKPTVWVFLLELNECMYKQWADLWYHLTDLPSSVFKSKNMS